MTAVTIKDVTIMDKQSTSTHYWFIVVFRYLLLTPAAYCMFIPGFCFNVMTSGICRFDIYDMSKCTLC